MNIENCGLSAVTQKALLAKKITTVDEYMSLLPVSCRDYTHPSRLADSIGHDVLIEGRVEDYKVKDGKPCVITAKLVESGTDARFTVSWFGQAYREWEVSRTVGRVVCVGGTVNYHAVFGFQVSSPEFFYLKDEFAYGVYPKYRKIKGVSNEMQRSLYQSLNMYTTENLEAAVLDECDLWDRRTLYSRINFPQNMNDYDEAVRQTRFRDLLYFASHMAINDDPNVKGDKLTDKLGLGKAYLSKLPFELTEGQRGAIEKLAKNFKSGFASKTLIQGDVGCGKTVVAMFALMSAIGSGAQGVLMAPTIVLAKQHYEGLLPVIRELNEEGFDIHAEFLSGSLTARERKEAAARIESGESNLVIGTHSVFTEGYKYRKLGVVIIDEEHRFGVKQRDALKEKGKGVHQIMMSATPIPRTLASSLYGESCDVVEIRTLPSSRKPVQSAVASGDKVVFDFIEKQLNEGRQAYIVCPLIEEDEDGGKGAVGEVLKKYTERFYPLGYRVECAHGKMKKQELVDTLERFQKNKTQILIATTVIEVGVNVPNANVIVIENAELFGLATLHQLRGRVGRGEYSSYCIFKSQDKENPRLQILLSTTNGFEISEQDMHLRGMGNLIGLEQTGFNKFVSLSLSYPDEYAEAMKCAKWALGKGYRNMLREEV